MEENKNSKENILKRIYKECKATSIITIVTFILSTLWFVVTCFIELKIRWLIILFTYAPCILSIIITLVSYLLKKSKIMKTLIDLLCAFLILIYAIWYLSTMFLTAIDSSLTPITDISKYEKSLSETELLVFPKQIPENVQNVEFIKHGGFLQGGAETALYYIDPNLNLDEFDKKYREDSIWIGNIEEYTEKPGLLAGAFSNTPAYYTNEEDYTIYLIEGRCDDSGYCNHGELLMVAVNPKTNEVVYKSEDW